MFFVLGICLEYPNLILETINHQIRVLRLNPQERQQRQQRLLRENWERLLTEKVGMYRIFLALTKACNGTLSEPSSPTESILLASNVQQAMAATTTTTKNDDENHNVVFVASPTQKSPTNNHQRKMIPLVVHNGLQDLLFLMSHFHNPKLPEDWSDCKQLLSNYFPLIYDTKCLAIEYCSSMFRENDNNNNSNAMKSQTHLEAVYQRALLDFPKWNRTFDSNNGNNSDDHQHEEQAHDAAYDAYMTGAAFHALSNNILRESLSQQRRQQQQPSQKKVSQLWNCNINDDGNGPQNKLYCHLSPFTIDLANHSQNDRLGNGMSLGSTYKVSNIHVSVSTRDIVTCLSGLYDTQGHRVNFEIIWVNDSTFLVAAMIPYHHSYSSKDKKFQEHGQILLRALTARFVLQQQEISEDMNTTIIECLADTMAMTSTNQSSMRFRDGSSIGSTKEKNDNFWNLWGLLPNKKKKRLQERKKEEGHANKKQRLS